MIYYKTLSDSPIQLSDIRCEIPYPNATKWLQCGYCDASGNVCTNQRTISKDETQQWNHDHELYTNVNFCDTHKPFEANEIQLRQVKMEHIIAERRQHRQQQ